MINFMASCVILLSVVLGVQLWFLNIEKGETIDKINSSSFQKYIQDKKPFICLKETSFFTNKNIYIENYKISNSHKIIDLNRKEAYNLLTCERVK